MHPARALPARVPSTGVHAPAPPDTPTGPLLRGIADPLLRAVRRARDQQRLHS